MRHYYLFVPFKSSTLKLTVIYTTYQLSVDQRLRAKDYLVNVKTEQEQRKMKRIILTIEANHVFNYNQSYKSS